jgi:methylated-DNA-[protein]-cysteine S-methyltransferase
MAAQGFSVFPTALGDCAVAWSDAGIVGVRLPGGDRSAARQAMQRRFPHSHEAVPPPAVHAAMAAMTALLTGERVDLSEIAVDLRAVGPWERSVYDVARTVPVGATLTYGEVAARLGDATQARAVGQALGRNPVPLIVPCHRVIAAQGRAGGFSAPGGTATKLRLLAIESAHAPLPLFARG